MENYKEKYEKALKVALQWHKDGIGDVKTIVECIFPELRESEDERIRKELIEQVVYIVPNDDEVDSEGNVLPIYQKRIDKYLAWLEKQGEKEDWRKPLRLYKNGYDQAMQDFLEKAEKWLEPIFKNLAGYNCGGDLINDFKNYMKDES